MTERRQKMLPIPNWPDSDRLAWDVAKVDGGIVAEATYSAMLLDR